MKRFRSLAAMAALGWGGANAAMGQAPAVSVGGVGYAQYAYQLSDSANHGNNFELTRAYLTVRGSFDHGIRTRVTLDVYRSPEGSLGTRLKYGFVSWTPGGDGPVALKMGMLNTPLVEWEETLWDYRMQGTVALDRAGYLSSADLGILVDGSWGSDAASLSAGVINGEGFTRALGDRRKDVVGRLSVRLRATGTAGPTGGLRLTGYLHLGKPTGGGSRQRYVGIASFRSERLTLAGELAATVDSAVTTPSVGRRSGRLVSAYGVLRVPHTRLGVIARFDSVDPDTRAADDRYQRIIAGVSYTISNQLRVLGDVDHVRYQSGITTPALEAVRSQALFQIQFSF